MFNINSNYFKYMAEASGMDNLIDTREAKINAIINDLRCSYEDPNLIWRNICYRHGIDPSSLTEREQNKINRGIR